MLTADELIQRHIVVLHGTTDLTARKEPFIREKGTPVWVVVGYHLGGHSLTDTAAAFALTEEEVQAALAYHQRHKSEIMQRIESNENLLG